MLFVYPENKFMSFWMKNVTIPLSIVYLSEEGVILEIHDMSPLCMDSVRSEVKARYALEVPQGWFKKRGLAVGDKFRVLR